jgi:hypothetical protein
MTKKNNVRKARGGLGLVSVLLVLISALKIITDDGVMRRRTTTSSSSPRHRQSTTFRPRAWKVRISANKKMPYDVPPVKVRNVMTISPTQSSKKKKKKNLWEDSQVIPVWMKDYFSWHQRVREDLNDTNWGNYKYLLLRCVPTDKKCAGAADRLRSVPSVLLMAAKSQRLLFISWKKRPAELEEFLVPPDGGFDWRLPAWLGAEDKLNVTAKGPIYWLEEYNAHRWPKLKQRIIRIKNVRGTFYYENHIHRQQPAATAAAEASFEEVYRDAWNAMFQPAPAVQALIEENMQQLGLVPGNYTAAHVRALYRSDRVEEQEEINAIACAQQLAPDSTIYFASDSVETTRNAVVYGRAIAGVKVVARNNIHSETEQPLHLDRGRDFLRKSDDWRDRPAADFYDTFVDLYLLAGSRCTTYGVGSYGSWANLLSHNRTCSLNHRNTVCTTTTGPTG